MSKIESFLIFATIAEQESFSKASDILRKSPSSVTKSISQLEADIGVQLFQRTTRHTALTEAGHVYLKTARHILRALKDAEEEVSELQGELRGNLRIISSRVFARAFMDTACAQFQDEYPDIRLEIHFADGVLRNESGYDVMLDWFASDKNLIAKRIGYHNVFVCASPSYLESLDYKISLDTLDRCKWLGFIHPLLNSTHWSVNCQGRAYRLRLPSDYVLRSNDFDFLLQQAVLGRGLLFLPQWAARQLIESGQLVRCLEDCQIVADQEVMGVFGLYPLYRRSTRKVQVFLDFLERHISKQGLCRSSVI